MNSINSIYYNRLQPIYKGTEVQPKAAVTPVSAPLSYPPDTVEISNKQTKKSKNIKSKVSNWLMGAFGTLAGVVIAGIAIAKHKAGKLTKLYNEKMQLVNLAEKIEFKNAKTVEEGIKFAKEVLKIGEVGEGFTLDAINYANRGLVEVSNANKGHLFMPKKMQFIYDEKDVIASVCKNIDSADFGRLTINKKYFDEKLIDQKLRTTLYHTDGKALFKFNQNNSFTCPSMYGVVLIPSKEMTGLLQKYYENANLLSINEKRNLLFSFNTAGDEFIGKFTRSPLTTLKKHKELIEKELNIKIDIESFSKKTTNEQSQELKKWMNELSQKNKHLQYNMNAIPNTQVIHHEMGHLQDFAKNLKELDLKHWKILNFNKKEVNLDDSYIRHVDNRWGGTTYDGYTELLEQNPKTFKKRYPDLYEFLTNQQTQQTAGKVSWYAQTSIGEFVAEVYAKMVRGEKLDEDIMTLYKKFNGPMLN